MKRIAIILMVVLGASLSTFSQVTEGFGFGAVSYEVNIPTSSFSSNYISKTSFYGGSAEGRYMIADHLSLGVSFSWAKFYEEIPRQTYQLNNGAVNATLFRFTRSFPIKALAHYYFGDSENIVRPYAGIGIGAVNMRTETDVSDFAFIDNRWNFIATPEAGALIGFGKYSNSGVILALKYNFTTYSENNISNLQYLGIQAGIFFGVGQ